MKIPAACRECGNKDMKWNAGVQSNGSAVNGRLRLHDIRPIFYLSCENCSETMLIVHADKIAEAMNTHAKQNSFPRGSVS